MSRKRLSKRERKANRTGTAVLLGIIAVSLILVLGLPQFYVSTVEITGQRVVTREQVLSIAGLSTGAHLLQGVGGSLEDFFRLRHADAEKKLLQSLPYLKNVEIRSVFPSILSVTLQERIEVAYIAISDGCVIIDSEGVALEVLDGVDKDSRGIPVIEGVVATKVQLGQKTSVDLPDSLTEAIVLLNDIINADKDTRTSLQLLPLIKTIRPMPDRLLFLTVQLPDTGENLIVKVKNSAANVDDLIWLRFALEQGKLSGRGKGILDLSSDQKVFQPEG